MTISELNPFYSPWLYRNGQKVCRAFFRLFWRCEVRGWENIPAFGQAAIFAANHRSLADPEIIGCMVPHPIFYFAKEELFHVPFVGWYIRRVNSFPVKRAEHDVSALKLSLHVLKSGYQLVLFPEGGRRLDPRRQWVARPGVALLAARTGAVVVPVGIVNSQYMGRFAKITMTFGKAMPPPQEQTPEAYQHYANQVMAQVQELCR